MSTFESKELHVRQSILYTVGRICDDQGHVAKTAAKAPCACETCHVQGGHGAAGRPCLQAVRSDGNGAAIFCASRKPQDNQGRRRHSSCQKTSSSDTPAAKVSTREFKLECPDCGKLQEKTQEF